MDAAIYGLLGAVIGALTSVGAMYVQQKQQNRRDRLQMAVDLAIQDYIQDYNRDIELAKAKSGGALVAPLDSYVICHANLLDALAEGAVTLRKIREKFVGARR